jgi:parallel beta-helix repeat protein
MSEHKNKLLLAIVIAAIAVILLGTVSNTFFPAEPNTQSHIIGAFSYVGFEKLSAITISNDGTVNSTAFTEAGDVYTQTGNVVNQTIIVQKNNVVIDGSGYSLSGSDIDLQQENNVTIRNMQFTNASSITLNDTSNCLITANTVAKTPNLYLIWLDLENSNNNVVTQNNLTWANIELMFSSNNTLTDNSLSDVLSQGIILTWSQNNTISKNFFENVLTPVEDDDNFNVISYNTMVNCNQGVRVLGSGNTVFGNNMTFASLGYQGQDWMTGVVIDGSNNTVYRNTIDGYALAGITVDGNTLIDNGSYEGFSGPDQGIGNIFFENIIACNKYGVLIGQEGFGAVDNNSFYHNDFINNYQNAFVCSPDSAAINNGASYFENSWDNGSQGNYWSNYQEQDPLATEIGNSGVMSIPYMIDGHNSDAYPLESPYMSENVSAYPNPFAGQADFPYAIYQVFPLENDVDFADNQYAISVDFYTLPPNVTLQLNPAATIINATVTNLRTYTFYLAEPLPSSTNYIATVIFGDGNDTQSYTWNCFTTPS